MTWPRYRRLLMFWRKGEIWDWIWAGTYRTIPYIPSSQECETDPLTILYSAGTCHEKLEEIFKDHLEEITVDF